MIEYNNLTISEKILISTTSNPINITIIDNDKEKVQALIERYDVSGIIGNGACVVIVVKQSFFGMHLEIIAKTGASCAPSSTVVSNGTVCKFHRYC